MASESMWLKMDGCKGEAADDKHKEEIIVVGWNWGMTHPVAFRGGGRSGGETTVQELTVSKFVDKASPNLMKYCLNAKSLGEVVLTARKRGENPIDYLKIKMKDAIVSSVSATGTDGGELPMESVALAFEKVEVEYMKQKPDGTPDGAVTLKWNIKENKEG
jgi:type VI secretion system secreted protein Hcp